MLGDSLLSFEFLAVYGSLAANAFLGISSSLAQHGFISAIDSLAQNGFLLISGSFRDFCSCMPRYSPFCFVPFLLISVNGLPVLVARSKAAVTTLTGTPLLTR